MFNKAYNHISERIDQVYKDLTKGKAAPMGGVAYLSLEDSEACRYLSRARILADVSYTGTLRCRNQIPCNAANEAIPRHGAIVWW